MKCHHKTFRVGTIPGDDGLPEPHKFGIYERHTFCTAHEKREFTDLFCGPILIFDEYAVAKEHCDRLQKAWIEAWEAADQP